MATFNPDVPNTPAPQYTNASQGTDKASLQPLATTPNLDARYFKPHYTADTSTGSLFEGLGKLGTAGLTLADNVIKKQADDVLTKGIDEIRDSFGVAQAADLSSGIAPAIGAAGQEGTSLAPQDSAAGQPLALNRLGNRVEGLTESFRQGGLSNSAYYAKLESFVRQTKQQFPGYGDQIDSIVSSKVGTTPANALRASLLQDVTALQSKVASQQNAQQKWEQTNAQYLYTNWPNFDQLKAEGRAPSWEEQQAVVGKLQARDYYWQSQNAQLSVSKASDAVTSENATSLATERVAQIGAQLSVSVTNSMGIKSPNDLLKLQTDIQTGARGPLTPEEKQQVTAAFAQLQAQYEIQARQFLNTPLAQGTTKTYSSIINDKSKIDGVIAMGAANLNTLKEGLLNNQFGLISSQANWNKAVTDASEGHVLTKAPQMADIAATRKYLGDSGITAMMTGGSPLMNATMEGMRQLFWSYSALGTGTASDALTTAKNNGTNDANLNRAIFRDAQTSILHPDRFPKDAPEKSVKFLFGRGNETLIDRFQTSKDQVQFFTDMVSPKMAGAVQKLDKTSQQTYTKWATDSFISIVETQAATANQTAINLAHAPSRSAASAFEPINSLEVQYDPNAMSFRFKEKGMLGDRDTNQTLSANTSLSGLNASLQGMKEVFKMKGVDPTAELMRLLPVAGVEPGTPIYKAIQDEFDKQNKERLDKAQTPSAPRNSSRY